MTNTQEALMLVSAGQGGLIAPAHTSTYYARPGITHVPLRDVPPAEYAFAWRTETSAITHFMETARRLTTGAPIHA